MTDKFLITVSGPDQPGITSGLMNIVAEKGASVRDIGQAVTYGILSLSFLLQTEEGDGHSVLGDLLFAAEEKGLHLKYRKIKNDFKEPERLGEKFTLVCVAPHHITPQFIRDTAVVLSSYQVNILRIHNLTPGSFYSLEMATILPAGVQVRPIKKELLRLSNDHAIDVAYIKDNIYRRGKRLIVFDMDSTLIQGEVIDYLGDRSEQRDRIREITGQAMRGEIDFDQALIERTSMLKGLSVKDMGEVRDGLVLTPGCEEFIKNVKGLGLKTAIISGGFDFFAEHLRDRLGLDYAFANGLEIIDGRLTGKLKGPIVNSSQKALLLK